MAHPNPNIEVTVVVSGQPTTVKVNIHEKVENLVREALHQTGNQGQPPGNWELRTADGIMIDQNLSIENAGIVEGMKLFLSPHAGAGGE
ncbi:MAG TPA: DUF2604 domain-containing protein [Candidatus Nanopelagicaceae bacterium]|jgi:hypothetical protein